MDRSIGTSPRHRRLQLALLVLPLLMLLCGMLANILATSAMPERTINTSRTIDLPIETTFDQLPPGIRDYIRRTWPGLLPDAQVTNPELGIDHPTGATIKNLPPGLTDYLRNRP